VFPVRISFDEEFPSHSFPPFLSFPSQLDSSFWTMTLLFGAGDVLSFLPPPFHLLVHRYHVHRIAPHINFLDFPPFFYLPILVSFVNCQCGPPPPRPRETDDAETFYLAFFLFASFFHAIFQATKHSLSRNVILFYTRSAFSPSSLFREYSVIGLRRRN